MVVAVNGKPVTNANELTREVAKVAAGGKIALDIYRDGKPRTVTVTAGLRPSEAQLAQNGGAGGDDQNDDSGAAAPAHKSVLGMIIAPIDAPARQTYGIAPATHGVVVQSVKDSSDAGDKGVKRGDVIVRAGDREVTSLADLNAALASWKKDGRTSIPLEINRGGVSRFVPIKIDG